MIFDTHIHLNDKKLLENLDKYIEEAKEVGVNKFLCVGYDLESSILACELSNKYKEVYAAIGFIPTEHKKRDGENSINELIKLIKNYKKVVAIGEIGLDYYWEKEEEIKEKEKEMFIRQISLANNFNLPISIHCRDAIQDTYDILKAYPVKNKGVMHCYSGSLEMAKEFIKLGYKIAFGGVLTFKNSIVSKEVLKGISLEDVVLETDAPYLAPMPNRGKLNEPKFISLTSNFASNLLGIENSKFEEIVYQNSLKTFHVETYEDDN